MIGLLKKKFKATGKRKIVTINRFCGYKSGEEGVLDSKNSINCDCFDGAIRSGVGLTPLLTDSGATIDYAATSEVTQFFWLRAINDDGTYSRKMGLLIGSSFYLYNETEKTIQRKLLMVKAKLHTAYDSQRNAYMLYIAPASGIRTYNETSGLRASTVKSALDGCVFKGRVFAAVSPFELVYSAPYDPLNFDNTVDDSGRIYLPSDGVGNMLTVRATEEELYIFYERGVTHLKVAGAARDFVPTRLAYGGGKIAVDSICACRGKMVFLAEDGLYVCEGKTTRKICEKMHVRLSVSNPTCKASTCDGKYLLNYYDEDRGKKLLVLDVEKEDGYFSTYLRSLCDCDGQAVCNVDGCLQYVTELGNLPAGEAYRFESTNQDFGVEGRKTLKKLRFKGNGMVDLTVSVDNGRVKRTQTLYFSNGVATVPIGERGEYFSFTFELNKYAEVSELSAELVVE